MGIGGISMMPAMGPQLYNTNRVSSKSLNKISAISDNVVDSKVDFSGLVDEEPKQENINPLRRGESVNFGDILASQMAMSAMNRDRLFG